MQASCMVQKKAQDWGSEGGVGILVQLTHCAAGHQAGYFRLFCIHCPPCSVSRGLTSMDHLPGPPCPLSSGWAQPKGVPGKRVGVEDRVSPPSPWPIPPAAVLYPEPTSPPPPLTTFHSHWVPGTLGLPFAPVARDRRCC